MPLPSQVRISSYRVKEHVILEEPVALQVSKAVDDIVTDVVDWAIQAPLRDRFRDFPEADMKEILHHTNVGQQLLPKLMKITRRVYKDYWKEVNGP
ncbi:hypothetical protein Tco_0633339 [Tanacetum coccineum]